MRYKEYRNELPINTVKQWSRTLMEEAKWEPVGWSGHAKEPYRHWAAYPDFEGILKIIWAALEPSFREDGLLLTPERVILNLYNHGDSSWLHKDSDEKDYTVIMFLNEEWDLNWGGDFVLVEDNELLAAFAATPGKFVVFESNILHAARPVSREAPYARFGLAFQCKYDSKLEGLSSSKISSISAPL